MNPYFQPFNDNALVETMDACRAMGIVRTTLRAWSTEWGFVQVVPKHGKPKWRGRDLNRVMLYKL